MRPPLDLKHSLISVVLDPQPLIDLLLPRPLLSQPSADPTRRRFNNDNLLLNSTFCTVSFPLHQVLVSDLAELHEIRFEAVHLLVDLPVVGDLLPQVLFQLTLTVVDLLHARLQAL